MDLHDLEEDMKGVDLVILMIVDLEEEEEEMDQDIMMDHVALDMIVGDK